MGKLRCAPVTLRSLLWRNLRQSPPLRDDASIVPYKSCAAFAAHGKAEFLCGGVHPYPLQGKIRFGYGDGVAHKEDTEEESENKEIETEEKKPVTEEEDDNVKNTNPVLEQQTDRCYGIWYPSEGKLEGEIRFLVTSGQTRPFRSEPISFVSQSSRIVIKIFQSKEKNQVLETDAEHNCDGIVWIPFHVKKGTKYNLTLTAQENYGVQVDIQSDNGEHYTKSTTDEWKKLTDE